MQGVGDRAKKHNIPVTALCGGLGKGYEQIYEHGIDSIMTTVDGPMALAKALDNAEDLYYKGAIRMFRMVALAKEKEGERALSQIKDSEFVILLDLHGSHWDSETFAEKLGNWQTASSTLTFVIAGSLGPSPALVSRANARWKLSDLTFTHLMTRVLVLEQIYRAYMILNGRKYHK